MSASTSAASGASATAAASSSSSSALAVQHQQQRQQRQTPPVAMFAAAPQADLFRSVQKDEYTLSRWRDELTDLSASLLGGARASSWEAEVDLAARAAYYGVTSLRGQPTLGEEYCDLMQVVPAHPYDEFRRERAERRSSRRASAGAAASASAAAAASSSDSSVAHPNAIAADSSVVPAVAASPSDGGVIAASASLGPRPVAAPLFAWARYNRFQTPSASRRAALFFVQVCAPYLYEKMQRNMRRIQFDLDAAAAADEEAEQRQREERLLRERLDEHDMPVVDLGGDGDEPAAPSPSSSWRPGLSLPTPLKCVWNRAVSLLLRSDYTLWNQMSRLHLALFYLAGRYVELSKRAAGVQYVQLRRLDVARPGYQLFGVLLLVQVVVTLIRMLRAQARAMASGEDGVGISGGGGGPSILPGEASASGLYALDEGERAEEAEEAREVHVGPASRPAAAASASSSSSSPAAAGGGGGPRIHTIHERQGAATAAESEEEESDDEDAEAVNCTLCLCPRAHTTATECGHLYCWECICECLTNKPECPMCRQPCALNTLLLLPQYK